MALYLTDNGKVIRRLKKQTKTRFQHRLRKLASDFSAGNAGLDDIKTVPASYNGYLSQGNTWHMREILYRRFILVRNQAEISE